MSRLVDIPRENSGLRGIGRATWLGHSTVLIEIDGLRVLNDPVWRPCLADLAGPKRFQPVPLGPRAMPPVDLVVSRVLVIQAM